MANGDIYQLIDHQFVNNQEIMNVYYYVAVGDNTDAEDLKDTFESVMLPAITAVQHNGLVHTQIDVINLDNDADFGEFPLDPNVAGQITGGAAMPSFVSWTFKLHRETRATRNGRKSIAGVEEGQTGGNQPVPAAIPALDILAGFMGNPMSNGLGDQYAPVIYGKETGPPSNLPVRVNNVADASFSHLSTQNSRKPF